MEIMLYLANARRERDTTGLYNENRRNKNIIAIICTYIVHETSL